MLRWSVRILTILSTIGFAIIAIHLLREFQAPRFTQDQYFLSRWNPATRRYTEIFWGLDADGFAFRLQTATALASDDLSQIRAKIGASNSKFTHHTYLDPFWTRTQDPLLWATHYCCTPEWGINQSGLESDWILEFRLWPAMLLLAILPAFVFSGMLWHLRKKWRAGQGHGFPVGFNAANASRR